MVAGAAGIALAELAAGLLPGAPSVVTSVGSLIINLQPSGAKQLVVDLFGTSDKLVLSVVVLVIALAITGLLGILARSSRPLAEWGFVAFGVLGLFAALQDAQVDPLLALVAAGVTIVVAIYTLRRLLEVAARPEHRAEMPDWSRRRFIGTSLAVAGAAAVGGGIGRVLLEHEHAQAASVPPLPAPAASVAPPPAAASLDIAGITPIVVPSRDFYRIDTQLLTPRLDASSWSLAVKGMVDRPFSLTYAELLAMPQFEQYVTIACVSNEVGGDLVGNARWSGVRLSDVLARAGVEDGASQLVGRAFDGWTAGFPTSWLEAAGRDAMIAVGMNGEALPAQHGFPARLIVPGLFGYVSNTKWLTEIELTTLEAFDAYWIRLGWAKEGPILTQSRIDTPRGGNVAAGTVPVAGVAWAPKRGISKVEVQVDDDAWNVAELSQAISDATWVQFVYRWTATPGRHVLRVRATDGTGAVQSAEVTRPDPDGARGYHTVSVGVE
jgi:DMSO/TMAO reductase YedYZ molybdopterin-dependent catalytic subunit